MGASLGSPASRAASAGRSQSGGSRQTLSASSRSSWNLGVPGDRPRLVRAVRRAGTAHHRHVPGCACAGARRGADRPGLDPRPWLRPGEGRGCRHPAGGSAPRAGHRPDLVADSVAVRAGVRRSRNAASLHRHPGPPGDGGRCSPALPELPPGPGHGAQGPAQAQLRGSAPRDSGRRGDLCDAAHGSRHDSTGPDDLDLVPRPARRRVGRGPAVRDGGGSRSLRWTWVMRRLGPSHRNPHRPAASWASRHAGGSTREARRSGPTPPARAAPVPSWLQVERFGVRLVRRQRG